MEARVVSYAEVNQTKLAAMYFKRASEAQNRARIVREVVLAHEQLSTDSLRQQSADSNGGAQKLTESENH